MFDMRITTEDSFFAYVRSNHGKGDGTPEVGCLTVLIHIPETVRSVGMATGDWLGY